MKITLEGDEKSGSGRNHLQKIQNVRVSQVFGISRWYIQSALLLIAFLLGAMVYRSGVIRPVTLMIRGFILQGQIPDQVSEPLNEVAKNVQDEIRMYENNGLPTLYIDVKFKDYQKLEEKRNEALKVGILNTTDADFVPAKVELQNGPKLEAKIRLKGDWTDHLEGDKWSFRIHLKDEGQILGTRQFSIQSPDTRNFLYEWAFHKNLQEEGLLTPRYQFVNVLMNGKLLGIYALEENFAVEMIESQGRRQGMILRFNEDPMWDNLSTFWANGVIQGDGSNFSVTTEDSAEINSFQESHIAEDPTLSAEAETASGLLRAVQSGQRAPSEVFDVDLTGRFFALNDLWLARHGVAWHNLRFYYNPITGKLEPVAYDAEPFYRPDTQETIVADFIKTKIFNDPQIRSAYASELERITQPDYVEKIKTELEPEQESLRSALIVEFPESKIPEGQNLTVNWDLLEQRRKSLALELQPADIIRGSYQALNVSADATEAPQMTLDLVNLSIFPVEVKGVEVNGKFISMNDQSLTLAPVMDPTNQSFDPVRLTLPLTDKTTFNQEDAPEVKVTTQIIGLDRKFSAIIDGVKTPVAIQTGPTPHQPTLAEALQTYPFLQSDPNQLNRLLVSQGTWNIDDDLILPASTDLYIPAGTTLRFAEGKILFITGSLNLLGQPNAPVLLTAQQTGWGGIVVLQAQNDSTWQNASVEKTDGIDRAGWTLTGGITFFKSNINFSHVLLGNNKTEDAINVVHSTFKFHDSEWENTFADALDSDFSNGEIVNCYFHDITGDAVDVSGTTATVDETHMERITDKGVSVGEASNITIQNTQMDIVGLGVASKDQSKATIKDSQIRSARFSALAAYMKKPVYGPGWLEAQNVTIIDTEKVAIAQTNSTILLNGKAVETVDLDVDKLYSEGILGN